MLEVNNKNHLLDTLGQLEVLFCFVELFRDFFHYYLGNFIIKLDYEILWKNTFWQKICCHIMYYLYLCKRLIFGHNDVIFSRQYCKSKKANASNQSSRKFQSLMLFINALTFLAVIKAKFYLISRLSTIRLLLTLILFILNQCKKSPKKVCSSYY